MHALVRVQGAYHRRRHDLSMETNPAVALFLALGIIILASRLGGALARHFGQPRVLGELIIGVLLGPTLLNILHWEIFHGVELEETIAELAEFGVLLLMFIIGLEVNLKELAKVGGVAIFAGVLGALVPVGLTYLVMDWFGYGWQLALFAGVTLAATSVSISAQVLLELGFLRTKEGNALLATALIDDVLAILLVSVTVAIVASGGAAIEGGDVDAAGTASIAFIVMRMVAYLVIASLVAWFGLPRLMNWLAHLPSVQHSYGVPAFAVILALLFGWSAEEFGGVAVITGSFIAGVGLSQARERTRHEIEHSISYIAYALLVPIFFVNVGLATDLNPFPVAAIPITLALLTVAIVSKMVGVGIGAKMGGFSNQESFRLGVCMISRGEVGLIIASLGISVGVFQSGDALFAALFMVILLTTLVTPIFVRLVFPKQADSDQILSQNNLNGQPQHEEQHA